MQWLMVNMGYQNQNGSGKKEGFHIGIDNEDIAALVSSSLLRMVFNIESSCSVYEQLLGNWSRLGIFTVINGEKLGLFHPDNTPHPHSAWSKSGARGHMIPAPMPAPVPA